MSNYNYIGVIGKEELKSQTVDIRDRDKNESIGKFSVSEIVKLFKSMDPTEQEEADDGAAGLEAMMRYDEWGLRWNRLVWYCALDLVCKHHCAVY